MTLPDDFWEQFDEHLNKAFDRFEKRFDRFEKRFDRFEKRFDERFDKMDAKINTKMSTMEHNLDKLVNWTKGIDYDDPINQLNSKWVR